jgi:hypothetical protein
LQRWRPVARFNHATTGIGDCNVDAADQRCVTHKLWTESQLDEWNEPAGNPNLRVFRDERQNDLLVIYDEFSDRQETDRARAFFLYKNQSRLQSQSRPHFVNLNTSRSLTPVPLFFSTPTNPPALYCEVAETNHANFMIYSAGRQIGSYDLPMYNDGWGQAERIAWTPFAVTADLTIVGGYLGCVWISSGGPGLSH